jgi:hypothetical protein
VLSLLLTVTTTQKIIQAVTERKSEVSADRLPYCAKGVGGVSDCNCQLVADTTCSSAEEVRSVVSAESEVFGLKFTQPSSN